MEAPGRCNKRRTKCSRRGATVDFYCGNVPVERSGRQETFARIRICSTSWASPIHRQREPRQLLSHQEEYCLRSVLVLQLLRKVVGEVVFPKPVVLGVMPEQGREALVLQHQAAVGRARSHPDHRSLRAFENQVLSGLLGSDSTAAQTRTRNPACKKKKNEQQHGSFGFLI